MVKDNTKKTYNNLNFPLTLTPQTSVFFLLWNKTKYNNV